MSSSSTASSSARHTFSALIRKGLTLVEELRWIDVMNDLAFLLMDLRSCGQVASARRLLDRYLAETGDYQGLQLISYYCIYRALVGQKSPF